MTNHESGRNIALKVARIGRLGSLAVLVSVAACAAVDPAGEEAAAPASGESTVAIQSELAGGSHFGPYRFDGDPTDEGTCGNWAIDTFERSFNLVQHPDGTLSFTTKDAGTFVTLAGQSPDACDPSSDHPDGHIDAGITGHVNGSHLVSGIRAPNYNPHGCDNGACQTCGDWAVNVLGAPDITVDSDTFIAEYVADPNQNLAQTAWHNASPQYGGNHGDIRNQP